MKKLMIMLAVLLATAGMGCALSMTAKDADTPAPRSPKERVMRRSASDPTGNLYFVAPVSRIPNVPERWGVWGSIDPQTAKLTTIYKGAHYMSSDQEYQSQSGVVRNNILYIPKLTEDMIERSYSVVWNRIDITTGKTLTPLDFGPNPLAYLYSMTYDPVRDIIYGASMDLSTAAGGKLVIVDCSKSPNNDSEWTLEWRGGDFGGKEGNFLTGICYNPLTKKLIAIKDDYRLYEIDPDDNSCVVIAEFDQDNEYYTKGSVYSTTPLCYSPRDKAFVSIYNGFTDTGIRSDLYFIDAEDYTTSLCADHVISPMAYVSSLHCFDAFAPDKAPNDITGFSAAVTDADLTFTYSFTVPTTTYDGSTIPASQMVRVKASLGSTLILDKEYAPGTQAVETFTGTQGAHTLTLTPMIGSLEGPVLSASLSLGHDNPPAPTGLQLSDYTLTWKAVEPVGTHGGYVQADAIGYNVYINARTKVNQEPIVGTECTLPELARLTRNKITVTAVANGVESLPSEILNKVYGPGTPLPATFTPTAMQHNLCEIYDADHNGKGSGAYTRDMWGYAAGVKPDKNDSKTVNAWFVTNENYATPFDEWLFLPAVAIADADKQYSMEFDYVNYFNNATHLDDLEIFIGKEADVKSMTQLIYSHEGQTHALPERKRFNFAVATPGNYIIGVHAKSGAAGSYRGVKFYNVAVDVDMTASASSPGAPTDVVISTNPDNPTEAFVDFKAPTLSALNTELDPTLPITVKGTCKEATAETTLMPGEAGRLTIAIPADGMQNFELTSYNHLGRGITRTFTAYVGQDAPSAPLNLVGAVARDNMSMHLKWDAPVSGVNGGYLDPASVTYEIFTMSGITATKVGETTATEFDFIPAYPAQARYYVGVIATNSLGKTAVQSYISDIIGRTHELPMYEKFSTPFAYSWAYNTNGDFSNAPWNHANNLDGFSLGDPKSTDNGMFYASSLVSRPVWSELIAQKVNTLGCDDVSFAVTYWDCKYSAAMELWGRTADNPEAHLIASLEPKKSTTPSWQTWEVTLPAECCNADWVQLNLRSHHIDENTYCIIDDYRISANVDTDFKVNGISGAYKALAGESHTFTSSLTNAGTTAAKTEFMVELLGDRQTLASETYRTNRIAAGETFTRDTRFEMKSEYLKYKNLSIRTTITASDDELEVNNTAEIPFLLKDHVTPIVSDLKGEWQQGSILLDWTAPDAAYGHGDEGFECLPAFEITDRIGPFKNYDLDGMAQYALAMDVYRWDGDDLPSGWIVYDAAAKDAMDFDNLRPSTGTQYIMARSIPQKFDENNNVVNFQSSDWLVSPEVVGGTKVSFDMLNLLNTTEYRETIEVYVSSSDDAVDATNGITLDADGKRVCGSFRHLRNFTKSGTELWETCSFTLPADAKHFALVYRSIGQFGACIDDLSYTPTQLSQWDIRSYNVVREDASGSRKVIAGDLKDCRYTVANAADVDQTFYVSSNVCRDGVNTYTSPLSNGVKFAAGSGVADTLTATLIEGGHEQIFFGGLAGQTASLYTLSGQHLMEIPITADRHTHPVAPGIYLVKCGKTIVKTIVK